MMFGIWKLKLRLLLINVFYPKEQKEKYFQQVN